MNVIFAGTPEFARSALAALLAAGHRVPLVLTQPDRPAGRGLKLQASAVKQLALEHGIPIAQPRSLRLDGKYPEDAAAAREAIAAAQADVMVVAAYGLILPQWVLDAMSGDGPPLDAKPPPGGSAVHAVTSVGARRHLGCLNIHASLLPRWRGAAPIHRAIEAGDTHTGITIMQMDAGLDTGDMLLVDQLAIADNDTTTSLHDKLAELGGRSIVQALALAERGGFTPVHQPRAPEGATAQAAAQLGITYAHKIDKTEARIDWSQSAQSLERKVRALDPFPGCTAQIAGETIKITHSQTSSCPCSISLGYGTICHINEAEIGVQCGQGVLALTELQRAGGKRLVAADFLRGFALQVGQKFE
jgi:methionyl-tRNA formyltransferase